MEGEGRSGRERATARERVGRNRKGERMGALRGSARAIETSHTVTDV